MTVWEKVLVTNRELEESLIYCGKGKGLVDALEMGDKRKRRINNDSQISGLNNLVDGYEENSVKGKQRVLPFWMLNLRCEKSSWKIYYAGEIRIWNFEQRFELEVQIGNTSTQKNKQNTGTNEILARGYKAEKGLNTGTAMSIQRSDREASTDTEEGKWSGAGGKAGASNIQESKGFKKNGMVDYIFACCLEVAHGQKSIHWI